MADDTTTFLNGPVSLQRCLLSFSIFSIISGLYINTSKSEALGLEVYENLHKKKPYGLKWNMDKLFSLGIHFCKNSADTILSNFSSRFDKLKKVLNMWLPCSLSLKGKITVIKNIILPQILYVCSNLAVPEWFTKKVTTCLYNFLWSAKSDRVKRATLVGKIEQGGLKMLDLESMIKSQRIMWTKRLYIAGNASSWTFFLNWLCGPSGLTHRDLLKCDVNPHYLVGDFPLFYHQMLFSWFELRAVLSVTESVFDVRRKYIIYNQNVLIGNRYAGRSYLNWYNHGIRQIHHLFDLKGCPYSIGQLSEIYGLNIDPMLYNSLITAIPQVWKRQISGIPVTANAINGNEQPDIVINGNIYNIQLIKNKTIYWTLIQNIFMPPVSLPYWQKVFPAENLDWKAIFRIPYDVTQETRIQSFQYKLILRIFPCNWYVSKFDLDTSSCCVLCQGGETDDLIHYFLKCGVCSSFWISFKTWCCASLHAHGDNSY